MNFLAKKIYSSIEVVDEVVSSLEEVEENKRVD